MTAISGKKKRDMKSNQVLCKFTRPATLTQKSAMTVFMNKQEVLVQPY